jgi:hypothetical protein
LADIFEVFRQYGVHYATEGDRHTSRGWVNTNCPFCTGNPGLHLGFNLENRYFRCWRCGWHDTIGTLVQLCNIDSSAARALYYDLRPSYDGPLRKKEDRTAHLIRLDRYKRPGDVGRLRPSHKRYLEGRGFDPERIETEWHVLSTGPISYLDNIDYRHRLFVPILWEDREVSFQTRDVTGKALMKYKACPMPREALHHKHILYGRPDCWSSRTGIAVEGVTDTWRLGLNAFGVFGIEYKLEQVMAIKKLFDRVAIVFDGDKQAQRQARKLYVKLVNMGVDSTVYKLDKGVDPGSLSDDDAAHVVRDVMRWQ